MAQQMTGNCSCQRVCWGPCLAARTAPEVMAHARVSELDEDGDWMSQGSSQQQRSGTTTMCTSMLIRRSGTTTTWCTSMLIRSRSSQGRQTISSSKQPTAKLL